MIPLESLRQSRCDWAANVTNIDCLHSKKGTFGGWEKGCWTQMDQQSLK